MKITGAELAAFEREAFPNGYLWDHELYDHAPVPEQVYDTDMIEGPFWGAGRSRLPDGQQMNLDLDTLIEAWRASRAYDVAVIRVPRRECCEIDQNDLRAALNLLAMSRTACERIAAVVTTEPSRPVTMDDIRKAFTKMTEQNLAS